MSRTQTVKTRAFLNECGTLYIFTLSSSLLPQEVKVSSAPFLLLRIPSLKLRVQGRKETFEANLKTETELWNLMVKEMWAGRNMADQHKVRLDMKDV